MQGLRLEAGGGNYLAVNQMHGHLYAVRAVANAESALADLAYSATEHRWWRIRSMATGMVSWDTSTDGRIYTSRASGAVSFALDALDVVMEGDCPAGISAPCMAVFDNYNLPP